MKTIFRILVILVVAVMVGGLLYGAVTSSSGLSQTTQSSNEQFHAEGDQDRPSRDGESDGIQFPVDSIKNLAIITVVGILYLNVTKFLGKGNTARKTA